MINLIALIAELHAHDIDLDWRDQTLYYVGNIHELGDDMQADLDKNQRALTNLVATAKGGAPDDSHSTFH